LKFLYEKRLLYDVCGIQPFVLEDNTYVFNNPDKFGIENINRNDKDSGDRLGYCYRVNKGMSQQEALRFIREEAVNMFRNAESALKRHTLTVCSGQVQ